MRMKPLMLIGAPLVAATLCFAVSNIVGEQRTKLDGMRRQMRDDRAAIALLSAELVIRTEPARLARLNELHLGLEPARATQLFGTAGQMIQVALATEQALPDTAEPALPRIERAVAEVPVSRPRVPVVLAATQPARAVLADAGPRVRPVMLSAQAPLLDARTVAAIDLAAAIDRAVTAGGPR